MKIKTTLLIGLIVLLALTGCNANLEPSGETQPVSESATEPTTELATEPEAKLSIIASLFPQYDFARQIVGDKGQVTLILPPGIEPHSFEPTPQDMVKLYASDLFLYTGDIMEPWAGRLVGDYKGVLVDLSQNIDLHETHEDDHDHEHEDSHEDSLLDPHFWTDPLYAVVMVESIRDALVSTDPENASSYEANAQDLIDDLMDLHSNIKKVVENSDSDTIISGGHFAFGYFVERYDLHHMSPYEGFSPDAEPTPRKLAELIEVIRETDAAAIFYEELVDPKVAKVISDEANVEMLLLHGAHNVTKEELESGKTYIDFMYENLERLKVGLGYHE